MRASLNKRLAPIVCRRTKNSRVPEKLRQINHIDFTPQWFHKRKHFASAVERLVAALDKNLVWVREGTRLLELATHWMSTNQQPAYLTLKAEQLVAAEDWLRGWQSPADPPSDLHRAFIAECRKAYDQEEADKAANNEKRLISQSRSLADRARTLFAAGDEITSMLLALEGLPYLSSGFQRPYVPETEAVLYRAYLGRRETAVAESNGRPVSSAAFCRDGARMVVASVGAGASVLDARTGAVLRSLTATETETNCAAFSPNGTRIVTCSTDAKVRLWDAETGKTLHVLGGHEAEVQDAAFYPDGSHFVSVSSDTTGRIWHTDSGATVAVLKGHEKQVKSVVVDRKGERIATASSDGTVRLWDAVTGTPVAALIGQQELAQLRF